MKKDPSAKAKGSEASKNFAPLPLHGTNQTDRLQLPQAPAKAEKPQSAGELLLTVKIVTLIFLDATVKRIIVKKQQTRYVKKSMTRYIHDNCFYSCKKLSRCKPEPTGANQLSVDISYAGL